MKLKNLMYQIIYQVNVLFPKPPVYTEEKRRVREREIVSRYANGQISLHLGKYITTEEIEKRKKDLASWCFS